MMHCLPPSRTRPIWQSIERMQSSAASFLHALQSIQLFCGFNEGNCPFLGKNQTGMDSPMPDGRLLQQKILGPLLLLERAKAR